jgi:predicted lipid-binding transport protein (Tim44 family)
MQAANGLCREEFMIWKKLRGPVAAVAILAALVLIAGEADARGGGGKSFGSRGSRTFSPPPVTQTAPRPASPMERTMTQPSQQRPAAGAQTTGQAGGFFNRPGFMGGLFAGFLGAGLLGMLFGNGLFGGLGAGFASMLGLILQIALLVLVARLIWNWLQRRNAGGYATAAGPSLRDMNGGGTNDYMRGTSGGALPTAGHAEIQEDDFNAFERLLGEVQAAYSAEDLGKLRGLVTPEMLSYFAEQLADNTSRGVINQVSDVKLEQGDLAESWREGPVDYATVAMRFALIDKTTDRATGKLVEGSDQKTEATELWTFMRSPGGKWILSAIQQA